MHRSTYLGIIMTSFIVMLHSACSKQELAQPDTALTEAKLTQNTVPLQRKNFSFGINGHPIGVPSYMSQTAEYQADLLNRMGMDTYRIDVLTQADGSLSSYSWNLFRRIQETTSAKNIRILPMVYTRTLRYSMTEEEAYDAGYRLGSGFAQRYGHLFTYYNTGNELQLNFLDSTRHITGQLREHYNYEKFVVAASYLKGMGKGIKDNDSDAQIIINACWTHFGYFDLLQDYGVPFDIVGWQWYDDMEREAPKAGINDITTVLAERYKKPIWFTEVGTRIRKTPDYEQLQHDFTLSFIEKCRQNPQVHTVLLYELFDRQQERSHLEANYGILKWRGPNNTGIRRTILANRLLTRGI